MKGISNMIDELQFRKKLGELLERAESQNKRLTNEEIKEFFKQDGLSEEQLLLVYDFLMAQKIVVAGYYKTDNVHEGKDEKFSAEEQQYLEEYTEDLKAMKPASPEEKDALLKKAIEGDALAKSRLIEIYLSKVLEIARGLHEDGIYLGDMVQEGNVSLILALETLTDVETADSIICQEIRQGILAMMEEQKELKRRDKKLENQINDLDDTLHRMADEKGRGITMSELAEHMQISEDEILDIIKLAGEDMYDKFKEYKDGGDDI